MRRASRRLFCGLSPRVRGKLAAAERVIGYQRSIPACAGEAQCRGVAV